MAELEHIIYPAAGGINKDVAFEAMPENDYPYSLNCIRKEGGEYGIITNAQGNELISLSLPTGTNKIIGFCEDKEDKAGIYFLYNSNDDHCIVRYRPEESAIEFLLENQSVLNFNYGYPIYNPGVVGTGDDKLLFWTDGYNPPRKLNITEAYYYTNGAAIELAFDYGGVDQCTIKFKLPYDKNITLDWGDGNTEIIWGEDDVLITKTSAYVGVASYDIVMSYGEIYLTYIDVNGQADLSGDVSGWSALTNLVYLDCSSTSVDGDVSGWSALTNLLQLRCNNTSVSGDVSGWDTLTALFIMSARSTSVGFASSTPAWSIATSQIEFRDCGWTSTEVDNALIAFANGPIINCILVDVSGTNAARTAASDAAKIIILANGNTLLVNE